MADAPPARSDPLPDVVVPEGVTVRTFEVGRDEDAWTALNARAFADHPDQGSWSVEEVRLREAEPWFDPAGFFLAERDGAPGRLPLDQGPRRVAATATTTTTRSARCTSSASTRPSRAAASARR